MLTRRNLIKTGLLSAGMLTLPGLFNVKAASNSYGITGKLAPELKVDY